MIKPSPPNKPAPIFLLKTVDNCTPSVAARNAFFCAMISFPGSISNGSIVPGKEEANAIIPFPLPLHG